MKREVLEKKTKSGFIPSYVMTEYFKEGEFKDSYTSGFRTEYLQVMNRENLWMTQEEFAGKDERGCRKIRFIGRVDKTLFIMHFESSPSLVASRLRVYRYSLTEEGVVKDLLFEQYENEELKQLPMELKEFNLEVFSWVQRYQPKLWKRCVTSENMGLQMNTLIP